MSTVTYEKPTVLTKLPSDRKCVIAASAGTGKTYTLEHLVLDLVLGDTGDADGKPVPLDRILVVTFTRRAAAEMTMRVRQLLESLLGKYRSRPHHSAEPVEVDDKCWKIDGDAARRIEEALNSFDQAYISTIHGFCQRLLKDYAFDNKQLFDVELVTDDELFDECFYEALTRTFANDEKHQKWLRAWLWLGGKLEDLQKDLSNIYKRGGYLDDGADVLPEVPAGHEAYEVVEALARGEDVAKNKKTKHEPGWAIRTLVRQRFLPVVEAEIERRKQVDGVYTYQDMLELVDGALGPDSNLLEALQDKFDVALVDEFQDTDPRQWAIFQKIFLADGGDHRLFLIGDEKQSIYAFRGADLNTYRAVVEDSQSVPLPSNWRSSEALIEAYNTVFTSGFFSKADIYPSERAVEPSPKAPVRDEFTGDGAIELLEYVCEGTPKNPVVEGAFVAKTAAIIDELLQDPPVLERDADGQPTKRLQPGDIYVLTLTNREADEYGDALRQRNIPYAFYRKPGLFETDEARHIHELLCAIARPGERSARRRALIGPFFGVPLDDLDAFDEADTQSWGPREKLESWKAAARRRQFDDLFERILSDSGLIRRELLLSSNERRLTNYRHIFEWLTEMAASGHLGLEQLADELRAQMDGDADNEEEETDLQRLETDRSSVQIMTIHKSKGLEAEVVFVGGGFSGPFSASTSFYLRTFTRADGGVAAYDRSALNAEDPAVKSVADKLQEEYERAEREEFERLFYVAITRGKAKVYLPFVAEESRKNYQGGWKLNALLEGLDNIVDKVPEEGAYRHISRRCFSDDDLEQSATSRARRIDLEELQDLIDLNPPKTPSDALGDAPVVDERAFEAIARDVRVLSSYSKLTNHSSDRGDVIEDERFDKEAILPGGMKAGDCLHGVLEEIDYNSADGFDDVGTWLAAHEAVGEVIDSKLSDSGFEPDDYREYLVRVVFDTLHTPIDIQNGQVIESLAKLTGEKTRREARFVVPVPEKTNFPEFGKVPDAALKVDRGYLHGFIDLLFEGDDGKIYFADWKSDSRIKGGDFSHTSLADHVAHEYRIQAGVYTLALLRLLGIADEQEYDDKVGGFFYFFVRGMRPGQPRTGYYFERPSWDEIVHLEERVRKSEVELNESLSLPVPQV